MGSLLSDVVENKNANQPGGFQGKRLGVFPGKVPGGFQGKVLRRKDWLNTQA
jgi:hypothetical protein